MPFFNSLAQAIPMFLQTYPSIQAGMKGVDLGPQRDVSQQMANLGAKQANLASAQYDMSNPYFQQIYGQEKQAAQQDLASGIAEISRQNRKLNMLGRRPLLDQERGGESIFRQLMLAQQGAGDQARQRAFQQLEAGQRGLGAAAGTYGNVYNQSNQMAQQQYENKRQRVGAYSSIGELLKGLFGLNQGGGGKSVVKVPSSDQFETINWNR